MYHAWKAKNRKKNTSLESSMRAPTSILMEANRSASIANDKNSALSSTQTDVAQDQRFFRIPFVRPGKLPRMNVTEGLDFEWRIGKKVALSYVLSPQFPIAFVSCPLSQK